MRKTLITLLAAGTLTLGGIAVTHAATTDNTTAPPNKITVRKFHGVDNELATFLGMNATEVETALKSGKSLEQIAQEKNISADKLKQFFTSQQEKRLNDLKTKLSAEVKNGKITQAQLEEKLKNITEHSKPFNKITHKPMIRISTELANLLSMSEADIKTTLQSGKTLEQLAIEHNVTSDQLTQFFTTERQNMLNKMKEELTKKVQEGKMTQAQMDQMIQKMSAAPATGMPLKGGFGMRRGLKSTATAPSSVQAQ